MVRRCVSYGPCHFRLEKIAWLAENQTEGEGEMSGGGIPWLSDDDQCLRKLAQSGLSFSEIAIQMNRARSVIRNHAEKLEIAVARGQVGKAKIAKSGRSRLGLKAKGK
jgi:hypothetical protein